MSRVEVWTTSADDLHRRYPRRSSPTDTRENSKIRRGRSKSRRIGSATVYSTNRNSSVLCVDYHYHASWLHHASCNARCMHTRDLIDATCIASRYSTVSGVTGQRRLDARNGGKHGCPPAPWHLRRIVMRPPRSERREHLHLIELEELVDPPARRYVWDGRAQPARRGDSRCKARYHLAWYERQFLDPRPA